MRRAALCCCLALSFALLLLAQPDPAAAQQDARNAKFEQKVRRLLEVTGAGDLGKVMMDGMLEQFRGMPNLPEGFIDAFKSEVKMDELFDAIIPLYAKYLKEEEIDAAIAFFETPAGRKLIEAQPRLTKESMEIGSKLGQEWAARALQKLEKKKDKP